MPDVRGRVRGPATAAGALLLTLGLMLPAEAAAQVHGGGTAGAAHTDEDRPTGDDGTGGTGGRGAPWGTARPAPAVSGTVPPPETAAGDIAESIATYDVVLAIGTDGVLRVRETITYDFDESGRHGIVRQVPFRRGDRLYEVRAVRAGSSTGAPSRVRTTRLLNDVQISVGARQHEVRGRQAYVIEYDVARVFTPRAGHDELVWDAIGTSWNVPIRNAAVRVEAPVPLRHATCRAGAPGATTRCLRDRDGPYAVDFIQRALAPREGMKIRVKLPKRAIAVPPPRHVPPRWAGDWPGTALLALSLGMVPLLRRRPAPRRPAGPVLAAAGALLVVADAGGEVAAHGFWAFSLGDRSLAGLALMIVGAGVVCVHRLRTP
ncbi:DUF2207 domain-containing protein [Actinomadura sp. 7K534]|uniref:DUF2207 domain-containing protein n=1 Tax=Actinomadura sp. 7K534 TaxID=2530366 RepID=UPI001043EF1F|nr:DUF2207 domain-containing protein [Actinomadura sp. 7K534]TDB96347.1 DUF2207 domain-containing protein [Actinomadura sp. 7K534]